MDESSDFEAALFESTEPHEWFLFAPTFDPHCVMKESSILWQWFLHIPNPRIPDVSEKEIEFRVTELFKTMYGRTPFSEYDAAEVSALVELLKRDVVDPTGNVIVERKSGCLTWDYATPEALIAISGNGGSEGKRSKHLSDLGYSDEEAKSITEILNDHGNPIRATIIDGKKRTWRYANSTELLYFPNKNDQDAVAYCAGEWIKRKHGLTIGFGSNWVERWYGKDSLEWYWERVIYQRGLVNGCKLLGRYDDACYFAEHVGYWVNMAWVVHKWKSAIRAYKEHQRGVRDGGNNKASKYKKPIKERDQKLCCIARDYFKRHREASTQEAAEYIKRSHSDIAKRIPYDPEKNKRGPELSSQQICSIIRNVKKEIEEKSMQDCDREIADHVKRSAQLGSHATSKEKS
jgi:hypothetical protein